ncbi:MAG: RNB domain-containing ribonuclease [Pseudomonadota bacterium]
MFSAVVVGHKGQYAQIVTENSRELTLNQKRILNPTSGGLDPRGPRHELLREVKERSRSREEQKGRIDARELWDLLQGEGESFDAAYMSELVFGDRDPDHVSATFRALFEEKVHFRLNQDRFAINTAEQVGRIIEAREREALKERLLAEGAAWLKSVAAGQPTPPPADAGRVIELLKGEAVWGRDFPDHHDAGELLSHAGLNKPEATFELLVALGVWSVDENLDLSRLDVPVEFSAAVLEESRHLSTAGPRCDLNGRTDLRGTWTATIDGPSTRDYDDALTAERTERGLLVGVHITDVSAYINPDSRLERAALERAATIYLPEDRIPMLPPELSEDLFSLMLGADRPAMSVLAEISPQGDVLGFEIKRSLIRVDHQLTYEEAEAGGNDRLDWMLRVATALRRRRIEAGAILLPIPEVQIRLHGDEVAISRLDADSPARLLVSEMMIMANSLAAKALAGAGLPAIFRGQAEPRERLLREGENDLFSLLRQCRQLSRAEWSTGPQSHSSLGTAAYASVTSPIRRAVDLLVQRQMAAMLGVGEPTNEERLAAALSRIEEAQRRNNLLEQRRTRYWLLRYLEAHSAERFEALVVSQYGRKLQVVLIDLQMEADLPPTGTLSPGERIEVKIVRVDARRDVLEVGL